MFLLTLGFALIISGLTILKSTFIEETGEAMNINDFARAVTLKEAGKKQVSIAQVKEVLKAANEKLNGELYRLIQKAK